MNETLEMLLLLFALVAFAGLMWFITPRLAPHTAPKLEPLVDKLIGIRYFDYIFAGLFFIGLCIVTAAMGVGWWLPFAAIGGMLGLIAFILVIAKIMSIGLLPDEK